MPLKKLEGGGERQKEEVNTMEIWKFIEWLCKVFFYDTNHHKNSRIAVSTGSKSCFPRWPVVVIYEVYNHVIAGSTADRTSLSHSLSEQSQSPLHFLMEVFLMALGNFFSILSCFFKNKLYLYNIHWVVPQLISTSFLSFKPTLTSKQIEIHTAVSSKQQPSASLVSHVTNMKDWPLTESLNLSRYSRINNKVHIAKPF